MKCNVKANDYACHTMQAISSNLEHQTSRQIIIKFNDALQCEISLALVMDAKI